MLFGQSVFQSVLTRLKQEHGEDEAEGAGTGFRIKGLSMGFVAPTDDGPAVTATGTEAYFAFLPDVAEIELEREPPEPEKPPPAPVIPAHLLRLTVEEIAAELAITAADTEATLAEKRRHFAKANHPDGIAPEFRENANTRMKTANFLIDTAIKGLFWR